MRTSPSTPRSNESSAVGTRNELTANNERALRRLFEQVYSAGELHVVEELVAPDYLGYCSGVGDRHLGPNGLKRYVARLRAAVFGLDFDIDYVRGAPSTIEVGWTAAGRLERRIMGVQPACTIGSAGEEPGGPEVEVSGSTSLEITDGVIQESHMDWHLDELRDQVGPSHHHRTSGIARAVAPRSDPIR